MRVFVKGLQQYKRLYNTSTTTLTSRRYGQPTPMTHPHLLKRGELTPGISAIEYELRRTRLMKSFPYNSVAVSLGYRTPTDNTLMMLLFEGFNEPDAAMILEKNDSPRGYKMTMFVLPKNQDDEMWDGTRTGVQGAIDIFGADEAIDSAKFVSNLREIVQSYKKVFIDLPPTTSILSPDAAQKIFRNNGIPIFPSFFASRFKTLREQFYPLISHYGMSRFIGKFPFLHKVKEFKPLSRIIQQLRIIKSDAEIKLMREAGEITGKAFIETMKFTKPEMTEHHLHAKLDYECRIRGAELLGYVPVIASGVNALTLHYVNNDMPLRYGDLVLVDAGCEYHGYVSDVTRTWPINGKFSLPQRELYEAVLKVNKSCIKLCTEQQNISLNGIHDVSVKLMREELINLGFKVNEGEVDRVLYPHHVGHYLGLDVHDTHDLDRSRRLKAGMVVTIEPGLYIPCLNSFPKQYHGIGIRIEDNVLIGEKDPVVLSVTAPKEIVDIEYCMNS
ncbi:1749_t:CDS:10 [Ambispora leptoticha]|uniref:1749_t:CDS:1 n=1 Tax=Ambispora leptoticha TaxID=144679 RepID=A0A9N8VUF5_9GLOM|nr:1749_t:CDS:10 [Ambispora leptoticha]